MRVLVAESVAREGIDLLSARHEVDERIGCTREELAAILPEYDALVVRSQVQVDAELISAGARLIGLASRSGSAEDLMSLDADGDEAISASEFGLNEASSARMREFFAAIDSDGDESLSASESQAFESALQQQVEQRQAAAGEERLSQLIGRLVQGYLQPVAGNRLSLSA